MSGSYEPQTAAEAGIPYYLRVEITYQLLAAKAHLYELTGTGLRPRGTYRPLASASAGERLDTDQPFPMSFDPADLLEG
jgi:hypothetical protein